MTEPLFRTDAYARTATTRIVAVTDDGGLIPGASVFYPRGGGQPGDSGRLTWDGGACMVAEAVKGEGEGVVLIPGEGATTPPVGADVTMDLDWDRRHRFMRMHTALHLLSVIVPLPVTGGQIGAEKSRLDFVMPEMTYDKEDLATQMATLIAADHPVRDEWITEADLDANPEMVRTLSVKPPRGSGHIRLVRIGAGQTPVDLQPCGGTHVRATGEIGTVRIGKIESKGKANRRISILLDD